MNDIYDPYVIAAGVLERAKEEFAKDNQKAATELLIDAFDTLLEELREVYSETEAKIECVEASSE